jgi:hypothetical protein
MLDSPVAPGLLPGRAVAVALATTGGDVSLLPTLSPGGSSVAPDLAGAAAAVADFGRFLLGLLATLSEAPAEPAAETPTADAGTPPPVSDDDAAEPTPSGSTSQAVILPTLVIPLAVVPQAVACAPIQPAHPRKAETATIPASVSEATAPTIDVTLLDTARRPRSVPVPARTASAPPIATASVPPIDSASAPHVDPASTLRIDLASAPGIDSPDPASTAPARVVSTPDAPEGPDAPQAPTIVRAGAVPRAPAAPSRVDGDVPVVTLAAKRDTHDGASLPEPARLVSDTAEPALGPSVPPAARSHAAPRDATSPRAAPVAPDVERLLALHDARPQRVRDDGAMRLELEHEQLGPIAVRVAVRDHGVRAELTASHEHARDTLVAGRPSLEAALDRANLRLDAFDVQTGGQHQRPFAERDARLPPALTPSPAPIRARSATTPEPVRAVRPGHVSLLA